MRALLASLALAVPGTAAAQQVDRPLSTDRPDKTESPFTVPGGRVQVELDFATITEDERDGVRTEQWSIAPFNLKLGVGRDTDLQLIVAPHVRSELRERRTGAQSDAAGFGDTTIRLKRNLWGNDGGTTAFALMPYITLPTGVDGIGAGIVEFGLIAPLSVELSDTVGLGLMGEVDVVADDAGGRDVAWVGSATLGFDLTDRIGAYAELFGERGDEWAATADFGLTYALTDEFQLDGGVNLGLTDAAEDRVLFVGVSRRF